LPSLPQPGFEFPIRPTEEGHLAGAAQGA
jgi:hypothetical protein